MRKYLHTKLLGLLTTIREAAACGLDRDCIDAFDSIRNSLRENLSDDGFAKYKDCLSIDKLDIFEDLLSHEQEVRKEVVFFPYNVSMWDSLESIWIAAKDDPSCFVSVVPIPYYTVEDEKGTMHYHGNKYPDYVPITDWRAYDLDLMRPDIAYVHNIYDDRNLITMVEPRFFTRNLKKYVDLLVYVPYYASNLIPVDAFAVTPVACAADIMIAVSDNDAAAYRNAGSKLDIVALGSPKIDRIIEMDNKKPDLPPEWHNLRDKKIFLYRKT